MTSDALTQLKITMSKFCGIRSFAVLRRTSAHNIGKVSAPLFFSFSLPTVGLHKLGL